MKINKLLVYLVVAVTMVLPLASGCTSNPPIEQAVICKEVSKSMAPQMVADNFTPDIKTIYCSVKLAAVQPKSNVKAEWYIVKSAEAGLTDTMIGTNNVAAETPYVAFPFVRGETLLPRGEYQVKLYFDNKFVQSVPFQVQGEAAASPATLSELALCSSIDMLTNKPMSSVNIFPSDTLMIYCSVKVSGADFNDQVKSRWIYVGGDYEGLKGKIVAEASTKVEGSEYVSLSIGMPKGKDIPTGDYNVKLYVGDKEQLSLPFTVVSPAHIKGPYVGLIAIYAYKDEEKKEINASRIFRVDTSEIYLTVKIYNAPPETQMSLQWIIARSDEAGVDDYLVQEDKNTIDGTQVWGATWTRGKDNFPKGDYVVKLLLDGQEKAAVPFRVQ
jgi:hypothetical protein